MYEELKKASELYNSGAFYDALSIYKKLLSQAPTNHDVLNLAAICELALGNLTKAHRYASKSIKYEPRNAVGHNILGSLHMKNGRFGEAISHLREAATNAPNDAGIQLNLANVLNAVFRSEEALPFAQRALMLDGEDANTTNITGKILRALGRTREAGEMFRKTVELSPHHVDANVQLIRMFGIEAGRDIDQFQAVLENAETNDQRARLHFALAQLYEKQGNIKSAFDELNTGNTLYRSTFSYDVEEDERLFNAIAQRLSREKILDMVSRPKTQYRPIFIVGMPRSGSTLIEQIISGHSQVFGAGEMPVMQSVIESELATRKKEIA